MENLDKIIIQTALDEMLKSSYFSVCTIDKCLKVANIKPKQIPYDRISALHCMKYNVMPKELYDSLPQMLAEVFDGYEKLTYQLKTPVVKFVTAVPEKPKTLLSRMF